MSKSPIELIVRGVLIHRGAVLLCRNRKHGHQFLPGGHVEFGEPARQAMDREIREEIGLPLRVGSFLGASESCFHQQGNRHHEINLIFELLPQENDSFQPNQFVSREDHITFGWIPIGNLEAVASDSSNTHGAVSSVASSKRGVEAKPGALLPPSTARIILHFAANGAPGGVSWVSDWM